MSRCQGERGRDEMPEVWPNERSLIRAGDEEPDHGEVPRLRPCCRARAVHRPEVPERLLDGAWREVGMSVIWECGKCKSRFSGSWMTEWCDCGNTRMMTAHEVAGNATPPPEVIRPVAEVEDGVLAVYAEEGDVPVPGMPEAVRLQP